MKKAFSLIFLISICFKFIKNQITITAPDDLSSLFDCKIYLFLNLK